MGKRVLVVDDDKLLASLIKDFLELGGHDVEVSYDAATAIRQLARDSFEVLITDLNISGPGDGYILAGVSRRLRPDSLILLLTGFPDLEGAWKSIQDSVNRLLLKPIDPLELDQMTKSIEIAGRPVPAQLNLGELIAVYEDEIVEDWYSHVETDPAIANIPLDKSERMDDVRPMLRVIEHRIDHPMGPIGPERVQAALNHGKNRREHGYPVAALLREASHLRQSITRLMTAHFLELDPRHALTDLFEMDASIDENMALSLETYLRD